MSFSQFRAMRLLETPFRSVFNASQIRSKKRDKKVHEYWHAFLFFHTYCADLLHRIEQYDCNAGQRANTHKLYSYSGLPIGIRCF